MFDLVSIGTGAGFAGLGYFLYRCAREGLPKLLAVAKAKWNAGKLATSALTEAVDFAHQRLDAAEGKISELVGEVAKLKIAPAAAAPAAAPANPAPAPAPAAAQPGTAGQV